MLVEGRLGFIPLEEMGDAPTDVTKDSIIQEKIFIKEKKCRRRTKSQRNSESFYPDPESMDDSKKSAVEVDKNQNELSETCIECKENNAENKLKESHEKLNKSVKETKHLQEGDATSESKKVHAFHRSISWPRWLGSFLSEPEYIMEANTVKKTDEIHKHADSLFSSASGFTNYRGLLNLCILLLVLSNTRLVIENILKYGILVDPIQVLHIFLSQPYSWPNACLVLLLNLYILAAYYTEVLLSKEYLTERAGLFLNTLNLTLCLLVPAVTILYLHPNPIFSVMTCGFSTIVFLKLFSYISVNNWCRSSSKDVSLSPRRITRSKSVHVDPNPNLANGNVESYFVNYPDNLTYSDIYYFMFTPTLCYELNFPRTIRIRKRFLLKRVLEMLILSQLMISLIQQWILPTINNAMQPLIDLEFSRMVERMLKLAIPNHLIWLIFFYWFFHSVLNIVAELLRFGDREFYRDWWNADSVNEFWQNWNIPVHRWAVRHLYKPLLKRGYSKMLASIAVFGASAFFHEYLVSVPLRMFRVWAFMGMFGQVPMAYFTAKYLHGKSGNVIVWLTLILGQPIVIFAYVHDYYVTHVL